jgi:hypothetical protein
VARIGGRNTVFAWIVGLACAGVVGALAVLALPMFPASVAWLGAFSAGPTSAPVADGADTAAPGLPTECRALYRDELWNTLKWTPDAVLAPSTDAPVTTAAPLVGALAPAVLLTCGWTSAEGTVSTTLAQVAPDAGDIAAAALPASGFSCADVDDRTRCTRTEGALTETIEAGGGLWLSTSESGWHPDRYVERVAERVWVPAAD